jgi:hypothetical protein
VSTVQGHCLCGRLAFEYSGTAGPANYCHCEDCRRCTGSAFGVSVRLDVDDFRTVLGTPNAFANQSENGIELTRHFCSDSGSPIYTSSTAHPEHVYINAGALDDPSLVNPTHQGRIEPGAKD